MLHFINSLINVVNSFQVGYVSRLKTSVVIENLKEALDKWRTEIIRVFHIFEKLIVTVVYIPLTFSKIVNFEINQS